MKLKVLLYFFVLICSKSSCQQNTIFSTGLNYFYGTTVPHSFEVQNTARAMVQGVQLEADWKKISQSTWDNCYCYPNMGVSLTYSYFSNKVLGHSITGAYFIEPSFRLFKNTELGLKGYVGLSYLTDPYDPVSNSSNMSYSMPVTGFLAIGLGIHQSVSWHLRLQLYAQFFHNSNGGIKEPNYGIDYPLISAGANYILNPVDIPVREKSASKDFRNKKMRKDIYILGSSRLVEIGDKERYAVYGAGIGVSKQVSILNAIVGGAEWHIDYGLKEMLIRENRAGLDYQFVGILAGNEFLLGKFLFSQQVGYYLYRGLPDFIMLYHRWGLMYRLNKNFSAGINLKAYADHVHFLDARVMVSF